MIPMWTIRILPAAAHDLARIDKSVARRIVQRMKWLAENFESVRPDALKGDLAGFFKLREGDFRIIYQFIRREKAILIHSIGNRSEIYRQR